MNRRTIAVFAALSFLVAALATASVAYRVLGAEAEGRKGAQSDFEGLRAILSPVKTAADLADPALRARLAAHYASSPSLLLVSVYERGSGMRWRIPSESEYLPSSENQKPFPEPSYPKRSALLLSSPIKGDITGRLAFDALYSTLAQGKVFLAFRDALLAIGAYLALAAIVLAGLAASARREQGPVAAAAGPSYDDAYETPAGPAPDYAPPVEEFDIPELRMEGESGIGMAETAIGAVSDPEAAPAFEEEAEVLDLKPFPEPLPKPVAASAAAAPKAAPPAVSPPARQLATPAPEEGPLDATAASSGLYSPDSGLGWESYLADRLDAELARSASFEQDLSLLVFTYDSVRKGSQPYQKLAKAVSDFFTFRDLAFERGENGFSVILANIDIDSALRMSEEFLKKLSFLVREYHEPLEFLPIFMGLSSRSGRLVDAERIVHEAETALKKACDDCDTHIIAFRPDADKYRLFLASKGC